MGSVPVNEHCLEAPTSMGSSMGSVPANERLAPFVIEVYSVEELTEINKFASSAKTVGGNGI